jgi:hypothetical protein
MLQKITIAVLLIGAVPIHGEGETGHSSAHQAASQNKPGPSLGPAQQNTTAHQGNGTEEQSKGYFLRLVAPENLPNIALFFVGTAGIFVACLTLSDIRRQSTAMEKSLILQFRPKIIVRSVHISDSDPTKLELAFVNIGGTQASIVQSKFVAKPLSNAPDFRLFDGSVSLGKFSLAPGMGEIKSIPLLGEKEQSTCAGFLWYADDLGIKRSLGIQRTWNPALLQYRPVPNSDAEYSD